MNQKVTSQDELSLIMDKLNEIDEALNLIGMHLKIKEFSKDFTDEQLYDMKMQCSWSELSSKTGKSVNSLRYRVKKYEQERELVITI